MLTLLFSIARLTLSDALRNVTYLMFEHFHLLLLICCFYSEGEESSELLRYVLDRGQLPRVFQNLPEFVMAVFMVIQPSPSRISFIEQDEGGMKKSQPTRQVSPVILLYANHFSAFSR